MDLCLKNKVASAQMLLLLLLLTGFKLSHAYESNGTQDYK